MKIKSNAGRYGFMRLVLALSLFAAVFHTATADAGIITDAGDGWKRLTATDDPLNEGTYWNAWQASYDDATALSSSSYRVASVDELYVLTGETLNGDLADPTALLPAGTYFAFESSNTIVTIDDGISQSVDFGAFSISSSSMSWDGAYHYLTEEFDLMQPNFDSSLVRNWVLLAETNPASTMVPEPISLAIFGLGTLGLTGGAIRRRKRQSAP